MTKDVKIGAIIGLVLVCVAIIYFFGRPKDLPVPATGREALPLSERHVTVEASTGQQQLGAAGTSGTSPSPSDFQPGRPSASPGEVGTAATPRPSQQSLRGAASSQQATGSPSSVETSAERDGSSTERQPQPGRTRRPTRIQQSPLTQPQQDYRIYIVKENDSLFSIAERFLGDGNLYPVLARINNISDPNKLKPGMKLRIPTEKG